MKANKYRAVLIIAAGILCAPVTGRTGSPLPGEKPSLIGRPHPALTGIESLRARILRSGDDPNANRLDWTQLNAKVTDKLNKAGITLNSEVADGTLNCPELRIYVDVLKLEDSQHVFRIQTSLARAVCLTEERNPVFQAEIWQVTPVMQAVPAEDLLAAVTNVVLEQVGTFIRIYEASNPQRRQPPEGTTGEAEPTAAPEKRPGPDAQQAAAEYKYVASKSGGVFHTPDCRWAKNISAINLVGYSSKDEAAKDGKRPCKSCNP